MQAANAPALFTEVGIVSALCSHLRQRGGVSLHSGQGVLDQSSRLLAAAACLGAKAARLGTAAVEDPKMLESVCSDGGRSRGLAGSGWCRWI
jgi:hypothetical protein